MTFNKRIKLVTVIILFLPLIVLLIAGASLYISWNLSWKYTDELSVPRFLHEPLLAALRGEAVSDSMFAGILLVVDDQGKVLYIEPHAEKMLKDQSWESLEDAIKNVLPKMPDIPINIKVYHYQGRSGVVFYLEHFFTGQRIFNRAGTLIILTMYFGLIVLPILLLSLSSRPIMLTIISLEKAAAKIGRGNLDDPVGGDLSRRVPRELRSLVGSFDRMREELKENNENKARIMMAISHDLKTPLTLIKGYVEALQDGMAGSPEEVEGYAEVIHDRSMLLEERINDLIYFAKLNTSDWQLRFEEFSLGQALDEAADIFKNDSLIRKREFVYSSELDEEVMILGDRKMLFQVFENLFDNACRYTSDGDTIRMTACINPDMVSIRFEDSGEGIGEQHRDLIFESFYRADSGRNTRGLGIGLTSAKTIIENHAGRIRYEPSDLGGACFIIHLPVRI